MLLAAEFQNALFSAAARIKARFVMIVKDDGTVVYYDQGFTQCFPESKNRGTLFVDKIFSSEQISRADAEKLFAALESHRAETIFIQISQADGAKEKLIVTLDPLPRPSGFTLIRGREYAVRQFERSSDGAKPVPVKNTELSPALMPALDALQDGLAVWDAEGQVIYLNSRLKTALGYDGATTLPSLHITDILNHPSVDDAPEGEQSAQLLTHKGEKLACHVRFLPRQAMQNAEPTHSALFLFPTQDKSTSLPFENQPFFNTRS